MYGIIYLSRGQESWTLDTNELKGGTETRRTWFKKVANFLDKPLDKYILLWYNKYSPKGQNKKRGKKL